MRILIGLIAFIAEYFKFIEITLESKVKKVIFETFIIHCILLDTFLIGFKFIAISVEVLLSL